MKDKRDNFYMKEFVGAPNKRVYPFLMVTRSKLRGLMGSGSEI